MISALILRLRTVGSAPAVTASIRFGVTDCAMELVHMYGDPLLNKGRFTSSIDFSGIQHFHISMSKNCL